MRRLPVILLAGVAACATGGAPPERALAPRPGASAASSAITGTRPAPADDDWLAVMRTLMARRDDAYERSDASLLDAVYDPACPCVAVNRDAIERARAEGLHTAGARYVVERAELFSRVNDQLVVVRAIGSNGPAREVDGRGNVRRELAAQPSTAWIYTLARVTDGWRIIDVAKEGPV